MKLKNVRALMIDLDGVVYLGDKPIEGAAETINFLIKKYKCIFVTNTTRVGKRQIAKKLRKFGIKVKEENIVTALSATIDYIKSKKKNSKCYLIGSKESRKEFIHNGLKISDENPDYVVIGWDKNLNFKALNTAFRLIFEGADFITMHEDKFAPMEDGLYLSVGPFSKALEYATGRNAISIGKPNSNFFKIALSKLKVKPKEAVMIGDSIDSDIVGAKKVGMTGILIRNGYNENRNKGEVKPDLILSSLSEIKKVL